MSEESTKKEPVAPTKEFTDEEINAAIERAKKEGSCDILSQMVAYAKRYNGFPYVSASRIERYPEKGQKPSILFSQLEAAFMLKNVNNPRVMEDFMETYASHDLVYIQVHADCPTVGADGLYNAIDINGKYIKTQLVGYFKMVHPTPEETDDLISQEGYEYFYKDQNDEFVNMFLNIGVPLEEWRKKYTTLYKAVDKVPFTPLVVVKKNKDGKPAYEMLAGNPYPEFTPEMLAAVLKDQEARGNLPPADAPAVEQK